MKVFGKRHLLRHSRHFVHLHATEEQFIDTSSRLLADCIDHGVTTIAIASMPHLDAIDQKLQSLIPRFFQSSFHVAIYAPVDAEKLLNEFMHDGWPDEIGFAQSVGGIVKRAIQMHRGKLILVDEMGALLTARGKFDAAARIEELWNELLGHYDMTLYCAYVENWLPAGASRGIVEQICNSHEEILHPV